LKKRIAEQSYLVETSSTNFKYSILVFIFKYFVILG